MSPEIYRVLHAAGALLLFLSLGGVLLAPKDAKPSKMAMALHGIALVIMGVAGFGTVSKAPEIDWGNWLYAKIGCWVFLAILPVLVRKGMMPRMLGLLLAIAAGATAVWLAQAKPF
ncbi:MAG: hypothetical protein ACI89X_002098 [Planctomycetota bacterium]|jgi:hypothetical protein